ncbi:MAG TPA: hypothetical protein VHV55_13095 [Pirellulales bacterium]|jgi:hypothetical protein|nr:hypothetical protein [Pirellulales bacterium]
MTETFERASYTATVAGLLAPPRLAPLGPGVPNLAVRGRLESLADRELFAGRKVIDHAMAEACRSALWLYHDFLSQSHEISQAIDTPVGSYWHGIMHRREPDFGNANYWFRRVGQHPIHGRLARAARRIAAEHAAELPAQGQYLLEQEAWDCQAFTELCRVAQAGSPRAEICCRHVQQAEWELLFDYCYHAAAGDTASSAD